MGLDVQKQWHVPSISFFTYSINKLILGSRFTLKHTLPVNQKMCSITHFDVFYWKFWHAAPVHMQATDDTSKNIS